MPSISQEMLDSLEAVFQRVGAAEGTLWLLNEAQDSLVAAWNTGPNAEKFVGFHSQSLASGLISLVCITGQAICENEIYRNAGQDPTVDRMLQVLTCSMIAVPLTVDGQIRGIISCVKLKQVDFVLSDPPPFSLDDLAQVQAEVEKMELEMEAVPA